MFRYTLRIETRLLQSPADLNAYDQWISAHPAGTLWQSLAWKTYQESLGRGTRLYASFEGETIIAGALVIIDKTSFGLSTWDIPRGPIWDEGRGVSGVGSLIERVLADAKKSHCLSLYLSPLQTLEPTSHALSPSPRHEQPEATRILDLAKNDDELLAQMHQKGRYNIKVAQKNEVTVRLSQEINAYYDLMKQTGERDRFGIKPLRHYKAFLEGLDGSFLMLAYKDETPIAGILGAIHGTMGIYYYGASSYEYRALMAPYLLQWEAIQHCKKNGCTQYDLLGVAPEGSGADHPWSGISSFKEKFGGAFVTYPPERQIVLKPLAMKMLQMKRKVMG